MNGLQRPSASSTQANPCRQRRRQANVSAEGLGALKAKEGRRGQRARYPAGSRMTRARDDSHDAREGTIERTSSTVGGELRENGQSG
jgi:hypothetical protein